MPTGRTLEVPIQGMDCAECTLHVQHAIAALPGVQSVDVLLGAEKAIIRLDPEMVNLDAIRGAVQRAGYSVPEPAKNASKPTLQQDFTRPVLLLLGVLFGVMLFVVVVGEGLGLFEADHRSACRGTSVWRSCWREATRSFARLSRLR